jgi:hypothetical protein
MPLISWLSRIPDDGRLRFGFPAGIFSKTGRWELDVYREENRLEHRLIDVSYYLPDPASIKAAFDQFYRLTPGYGIQFFVRDNDLNGNNRLYQPSVILEYPDNLSDRPGIIRNTPPPLQYGGYVGEDFRESPWDQHPQAAPIVRVPSNGRNEEQENQDKMETHRVCLNQPLSKLMNAAKTKIGFCEASNLR